MKVFVLTSDSVIGGVFFPKVPQVFRTRRAALEMFETILREEIIPEYIEIRGYNILKRTEDTFTATLFESFVRLSVDGIEMK